MREAEDFFWNAFCDNYLEIVKGRLYGSDEKAADAARKALYDCLYMVLRLFAPILVHITEELYQLIFREREGHESIHTAPWPVCSGVDFDAIRAGDIALEVIEAARRFKSERNLSMAAPWAGSRFPDPTAICRS